MLLINIKITLKQSCTGKLMCLYFDLQAGVQFRRTETKTAPWRGWSVKTWDISECRRLSGKKIRFFDMVSFVRSFVRSFPRSFVTLSFRFLVFPAFLCNFSFRFLVLSFIFPSSLCHFTLSSSYHCIFPSPIRLFFLSPVVCLQSGRVQSVRHSVTLSFRFFSSSSLRPSFRR